MENKKANKTSVVALIVSILPIFTLIPVFLQITLSDGVRLIWVGFNMICVLLGFVLSIIGIRRSERKGRMEKVSNHACVNLANTQGSNTPPFGADNKLHDP